MLVKPRIINNICLSSHPLGCAADVQRQVDYVKKQGEIEGPKNVLVIGSSTGYGLASRITAAFGMGANTIGVAFEKAGSDKGPGTAGFYNTIAFDRLTTAEGLFSQSFNADAFSTETKSMVAEAIQKNLGKIDLLIYSLASPVRTDPVDSVTYRSVLKPIGSDYVAKSIDPFKGEVKIATVTPANPEEVQATIKVMGGEDWQLWVETLAKDGRLAEGFKTVAYSYIGPQVTYPFYRSGTIGKAKEHLEATVKKLDSTVLKSLGGKAFVSINKALVTRASAVIPAVSLYISLLYKVMKAKGIHEGCIEQIDRLFRTRLFTQKPVPTDDAGLIRIDDWEMRSDVQAEIATLWETIDASNLSQLADVAGFEQDFLQLNGFALPGVDYEADVSVAVLEAGI